MYILFNCRHCFRVPKLLQISHQMYISEQVSKDSVWLVAREAQPTIYHVITTSRDYSGNNVLVYMMSDIGEIPEEESDMDFCEEKMHLLWVFLSFCFVIGAVLFPIVWTCWGHSKWLLKIRRACSYSNTKTALFYNLLTTLLEYIDPTQYAAFPHLCRFSAVKGKLT